MTGSLKLIDNFLPLDELPSALKKDKGNAQDVGKPFPYSSLFTFKGVVTKQRLYFPS